MRVAKACTQCRDRKRKCIPSDHSASDSCTQCVAHRLQCSRATLPSSRSANLLPRTSLSNNETDEASAADAIVIPLSLRIELVELYLHWMHNRPHSLFHPASLMEEVREDRVGKVLLYGMCCMGCRFSENDEIRKMSGPLLQECKTRLLADLDHICLENIQACVLVANLCGGEGNPSSEALFYSAGLRMAQLMKLDVDHHNDTAIIREIKRRIWWSLFMGDTWCSSGLGLPQQMKAPKIHTTLPMNEHIFCNFTNTASDSILITGPGLWAHMITLVEIYGPIQDLNRDIANSSINSSVINAQASNLANRLENWQETLPADMVLNTSNLHSWQRKGLGGPFVALHFGYYHYATLLYFPYLEKKDAERYDVYKKRCKEHASSYSELLKQARQERNCEVAYCNVTYMTLMSTVVLLHTLLSGDNEAEMSVARENMIANFEALIDLAKYWPVIVTQTINRIYAFQDRCMLSLRSASNQTKSLTHELDNWMVRFLQEHYLPVLASSSPPGHSKSAAQQLGEFYSNTFNVPLDLT